MKHFIKLVNKNSLASLQVTQITLDLRLFLKILFYNNALNLSQLVFFQSTKLNC